MKRILSVFLIILIMLSAAGCNNSDKKNAENAGNDTVQNTADSDAANGAAEEGGEISVFSYKPDTFCPVLSTNKANLQMLGIIYEGLIKLDDELMPQPSLAESWTASENGREWRIVLRSGVKWHSGEEFGPRDVVYTVNQIKRFHEGTYSYNVSHIASVKEDGENAVRVKLNEPCPNFINLLYFPIIRCENTNVNAEEYLPNGTGPYVFEDRNEGNIYYLVRNNSWWGGRAVTDTIRVKLLPDRDTALYAFSSGSIDMTSADNLEWGKFVDAATSAYTGIKTPVYNFLGINHKNALLAMDEVRTAISCVIDRKEVIDESVMGYAEAASAPVRSNWFVSVGQEFNFVQNTNAAKKELLDNDWSFSGGKYTKKSGRKNIKLKFDILINEDSTVRDSISQVIKKNLEEFGFEITVTKVPFDEYTRRIQNGKYDTFLGSYALAPDLNFDVMLGDGNVFRFSDDEMKLVLDGTKSAADKDKTVQAYAELINLFNQINPVVGLFFEDSVMIYNKKITGDITPSYFNLYNGIEKLHVKEVKKK